MGILIKLIATGTALWVAIWLLDGLDFQGSFLNFVLVTAIVVGANLIVKPILKLLSIPFIILSLGLFLLVVNALTLQLAVWLSGVWELGFTSTGFFWATFLGAVVISIVAWAVESVLDRAA